MRRRALMALAGLAGGLVAALAALTLCSGCSSLGYYAQSASGHVDLMRRARPIDDWLADPVTAPALRERLALAKELRRFAVSALGLPDNASYTRYADLGRDAAVWNVVAAPALSLELHRWCYPVLGCVGYRGYFRRSDTDAEAATLRAQGLDVLVYGVPAYSTLGWSNWVGGDPLLNTFVRGSEAGLARLVFHELAHQVAYAEGDTEFNESYATAVETLGLARWREAHAAPEGSTGDVAAAEAGAQRRRADFRALTQRTRVRLQALYADPGDAAAALARKAETLAGMRAEHAALKAGPWQGSTAYDDWFANANNASFAILAAYDGLVPDFERLFRAQGSDFRRFHAEVRRLADLPAAERRATLHALP